MSSQHLGKYELREPLGRGGMAEVWKAFDTQLHRYVAIKILHAGLQSDPEFITRFTREARVIASLHHPNIVQIHDFQTATLAESNTPIAYMVMDYIEGQTLAQYIRQTSYAGKFPPATDILYLFTSISKAIDYAHHKGMIHRDIKPANILLDKRNTVLSPMGEPVLTDFGIAKLIDTASGTMIGMWLGTPLYISPEQAQGQPGNERSDIYSLGVILYEMCSGVQPFRGESVTAITWQHIHTMPTPPALINPTIPPALTQVILRAMAKNAADRFNSASAMSVAIAEAFHLPVPEDQAHTALPVDNKTEPTYLSPRQPHLPPPLMPFSVLSSPLQSSVTPSAPSAVSRPSTPIPGTGEPFTPYTGISNGFPPVPAAQNAQSAASPPMSPSTPLLTPPSTPPPSWRRRKWPLIVLFVVILLVLASSSIGALYLLSANHTSSTVVATSPQVVGNVYFLSSGQVNPLNSQGVDDEVQVSLHNIPNPAAGKSYYAWLSSTPLTGEGTWVLLGSLKVNAGNAQLASPYQDPQHANLLINASSFLVTEENSNTPPVAPSDRNSWSFYSEPPQLTLLHLRHLLANSPELAVRQLDGGLGIWFLKNTEKLVEWSGSARDTARANSPDTFLIHRQIIHILDYIDGEASVSMDVPAGTPLLVSLHDSQIALIGPPVHLEPAGTTYQGEVPPGYVYLIPVHLNAAVEAPQATAGQRQLARLINSALNQVTIDLQQARQDARQLATLNGVQLLTPTALSLLNDLVVRTQNAYTGPLDPTLPQGGVYGIYTNLQRMAIFDVYQYAKQ